MTVIRPYRPADLPELYRIALATGDAGADASHLYADPNLVGAVFAAPYACLFPQTALVAEDRSGVGAYIVGAADTRVFEERAERAWWPHLRERHVDPSGSPHRDWSADQRLAWAIHHPWLAPDELVARFPSHLHINLLPRLQGQGLGRRLMDAWLALAAAGGSKGVHLGVNTANQRAIGFYRALGLSVPELGRRQPRGVIWFAAPLP